MFSRSDWTCSSGRVPTLGIIRLQGTGLAQRGQTGLVLLLMTALRAELIFERVADRTTGTHASGNQAGTNDRDLMRRNWHSTQRDFRGWRLLLDTARVEDRHLQRGYGETRDFILW
jgi:hypothetical protein